MRRYLKGRGGATIDNNDSVGSRITSTTVRLPTATEPHPYVVSEGCTDDTEGNDDSAVIYHGTDVPPNEPPRGLDPPANNASRRRYHGKYSEESFDSSTLPLQRPSDTISVVEEIDLSNSQSEHYTELDDGGGGNFIKGTTEMESTGGSGSVPDLSNLWRRKQSTEGWYNTSTTRNASSNRLGVVSSPTIRYPKIVERAVHVPPIEALLSSKKQTVRNEVPDELPKTQPFKRATTPGAVAVSNDAADPTSLRLAKKSLDVETAAKATKAPKPTIASSDEGVAKPPDFLKTSSNSILPSETSSSIQVSMDSDNSFWEKKVPSTVTTTKFESKQPTFRQSSLQLESTCEHSPELKKASLSAFGWNDDKNKDVAKEWQANSVKLSLNDSIPPKLPIESYGGKPKSSLIDEDDENDDEDVVSQSQSENIKNVTLGTNRMAQMLVGVQPLWGRKAEKSSNLEDDEGPDSRELAFAEGRDLPYPFKDAKIDFPIPAPYQIDDDDDNTQLEAALMESQAVKKVSSSDDEELAAALRASKEEMLSMHSQHHVSSSIPNDSNNEEGILVRLSDRDIEDAKENARSVRGIIVSDDVDFGYLQTVLDICRADQRKVTKAIEGVMFQDEIETDLSTLIDLNNNILDVIEAGERIVSSSQKPSPAKKSNLDVEELINKKDIFSLICMLRVQMNEKRLDAAFALMRFSRSAEKIQDKESIMLRDEIRSSGGLLSLLTLFRTRGILHELKSVTALAVAYLLPSFVESSSHTPPSLCLRIVECLRFLTTTGSMSHDGEMVGDDEMLNASALALASFWVYQLEPILSSKPVKVMEQSISLHRRTSRERERNRGEEKRNETITITELLDTTVSLIMYFAKLEAKEMSNKQDRENTLRWSYTLVEQVCAVEVARPIAVREGVLHVLVCWIQSQDRDRIRTATSALRYITSIQDKYMAGWIHSEMINQGAVQCLADLTRDFSLTRDVRLSIAQILSSLCAAPHTRAAVVETNCINFLIGILYEHSDPSSSEVALFAVQAILQLAAGAISRASAFVGDDVELFGATPIDRRDSLIGYIVESGAVASFVAIAQNNRGMLRSLAIQALRVFSEDVNMRRRTRVQLCEDSAAIALGTVLKDSLPSLADTMSKGPEELLAEHRESSKDLFEALWALANILDPTQDGESKLSRSSSNSLNEPHHLIKGCLDTATSGGLEALLAVASSPFNSTSTRQTIPFLEEACKSLSFISPFLLSSKVASAGYSSWAHDVLLAFHLVLRRIDESGTSAVDLQIIVLNGLGALAKSAPLKIRIIDKTLPSLLQAKDIRNRSDVANAAGQTFQSLDLTEDEVAVQVAGNARNIFVEWFCLKRSLLLQAMARVEIRRLLRKTWGEPFEGTDHGTTRLMREGSRCNDESVDSSDSEIFGFLVDDECSSHTREKMLSEYDAIYGSRYANGSLSDASLSIDESPSLLSEQTFPLDTSDTETKWILDHRRSILNSEVAWCLPDHIEKLLYHYFPSKLLRDDVFPIYTLQPEASFNFRAFMMAQKRYFSFRREGQLLSSLCDKEAGILDAHWSLGFTNSSFAGEFAESLVQVLYKCPMIRALSFKRNSDWKAPENDEKDSNFDPRDIVLANLAGSLPPWISHLTFDGIFGDMELRALVNVVETMDRLSEDQKEIDNGNDGAFFQGKFWFLAICRSPYLSSEAWLPFFKLLGGVSSKSCLTSLKALDLSGNQLGDILCAEVLQIVLDEKSSCCLEQLDLSGNRIGDGDSVFQVLTNYFNRRTAIPSRRSPLHTLIMASNSLSLKRAVALIHNNRLGLKVLDLSSNNFSLSGYKRDYLDFVIQTVSSSSGIDRLNLSCNCFSHSDLDHIIIELSKRSSGYTILHLDGNTPQMTTEQNHALQSVARATRKRILQRHLNDRDKILFDTDESLVLTTPSVERLQSMSIPEGHAIEQFTETNTLSLDQPDIGDNSITVLFSAPLVYTDGHTLRPFAKLDFDMERELMWQCLKEASRDIELSFDSATHQRLLATMTKRCSCLHYSGHGHQHYLPFEDGSGGPYWFQVNQFKSLIETNGVAPFRFVFVSACFSYLAGETFASAGVPHVVCCQQESELKDTAALAFTRQFYLALAVGHTVKASFEQGCKAVRATPNLKDPDAEMNKFLLLPKDGNHDVPIFNAPPVPEWPKHPIRDERRGTRHAVRSFTRSSYRSLGRSIVGGGARTSELSVRNMMQEDPSPSPPEFFIGREVDTYYVLKAVLGKRLVSVVGEPGIGRSSLVCALCHYINERASTIIGIDRIIFVRTNRNKRNPLRSLVQRLLKKLTEEEKARPVDADADMETMFDTICKFLKLEKALVVFDHCELIVDTDEANEFPLLLSKLCRETKNVKVLLTNRSDLGIPSLGEHPISLGPLKFADTVRLFANLCPFLHTPADRKKLFESLVKDNEVAEVLATDPTIAESTTKRFFTILGDGVPSRIEKAAYDLSKEDFLQLYKCT